MNLLAQWFWRLLPANPMAARIVQGGSRRSHHLWVRMGYLGALILLVLLSLISARALGQEASLGDLAKAGTSVFAVVAYGQVILVCLIAPLFMAAAISQERAGQTLDILLTTPLSNLQIVLGSLTGRLFFILALLLSGLPLFSILLIFGGVPVTSVFISFGIAALTAIVVGAVAVGLSVLRLGGRKAVFGFVIVITAYLVAAYALDVALLRPLNPGETTWLTPLHPLLVLEASLSPASYRAPLPEQMLDQPALLRFYLGRPLAAFTSLSVLLSFVLTVGSAVVLRHPPAPLQGSGRWTRLTRRLLRLRPLGGERRRPPREVWANPIAWREAHTRGKLASGILARWSFAAFALLAAGGVLLAYHFGGLPQLPGPGGQPLPAHASLHSILLVLLLLEVAVVTLVALYMSAGSVSREREDGTLDLVLTTPVTPKQYIWGKLRGLVSFLSLLIAVPVLTLAMVSLYAIVGRSLGWDQATYLYSGVTAGGGRISREPMLVLPEAPVLLLGMLVPFVALCVATGMNWSLKARGVLGAVVSSVAIIGILVLVLGFCGWNTAREVPLVGPVINAFSPATNLFMLVDPWNRVAGFAENPVGGRISMFVAAALVAAGYGVIVYAMISAIVSNFDQTVRRLSGTG